MSNQLRISLSVIDNTDVLRSPNVICVIIPLICPAFWFNPVFCSIVDAVGEIYLNTRKPY
ncbi:MAG: hypothetical protein RM368_35965 [Nostoc sp. DedSLP03]|nr:hypothetical protein [Nostoc sp. DedSLP03]